jgi:hypothetical protein
MANDNPNRSRFWRHAVAASLCGAVALVIASCTLGPRDPSIAGVIADSERLDGVTRVTFQDGSTLDLNFAELEGLEGSSGGLEPGTLLMTDATGDWYVTLDAVSIAPLGSREPRDCFFIGTFGTRDDGHNTFDNGLRLPLVPDFDPGSVIDSRFDHPTAGFCADEAGRLLFYDS